MTNPMLAELDEVVRLAEKATPGPWDVRRDDDELRIHAADTQSHGFTLEMRIASDINGYGKQRDDGSWDYSESEHNAQLIAKSVNFLRTHHATLADMAKRLEALQSLAAAMYQAAGAYDMPVRFLDVLSAAGDGEAITEEQVDALLPCETPDTLQRLEAAQRKVSRLTAMRNEWERDAREHLMTFGQHLPASVECLVERFDVAIDATQEGEG